MSEVHSVMGHMMVDVGSVSIGCSLNFQAKGDI